MVTPEAKARAQQLEIYALIGEGITKWQAVEDSLAGLFAQALMGDQAICMAAYHAIVSFEARLNMVDAVVSMRLKVADAARLTDWRTLANRLSKKSRKRAEIAHCRVMSGVSADDTTVTTKALPFYAVTKLTTAPILVKHDIPMHEGAIILGPDELRHRIETFKTLRSQVQDFEQDLETLLGPPPLFLKPKSSRWKSGPSRARTRKER